MSSELDVSTIRELLAADHDQIRQLIDDFLNAVHADHWQECDRVFERLEQLAERHMTFEEDEVFPVFEKHPELSSCANTSTIAMRTQHAAIRASLCEIGIGLQLHQVREASIQRFAVSIKNHSDSEDAWADSLFECLHRSADIGFMDRLRALLVRAKRQPQHQEKQ